MTVGRTARLQFNMAKVQTQYGSALDKLQGQYLAGKFNNYGKFSSSTQSLNDLLKSNALKNKSDIYREKFSELYKSIYGIDDSSESESSVASSQSIKTASANAGGAAESIKSFANDLKYGGEVDIDAYKAQAQSFVDNYNSMIDKVGNSDNQNVLQKGVLMVNTGKVYSNSLRRAGITVGADNKLTLSDDLSKIKASDIKTAFGTNGFSDKVIQKSRQINTLTGGSGLFTKKVTSSNKTDSTEKTDNSGTLKEMTNAVKEAATAVKSYIHGLGSEENSFSATDFTDTAKDFVNKYNSFMDEMEKSNKSTIQQKGTTLAGTARAYKHMLGRAGISVDENGRLSITDAIKDITEKDAKYSFGSGAFLDKVTEKANQVNSLVSSAKAMGYNSDKTSNYAYTSGALYSVYA
ncbi:MAG: hypothetical protein K2N06_11300 [Oscillospiraceae bacterium]|nr:hypothetical protein [Oscillospiraceae bacterium]